MTRDTLFLLDPSFEDPALPGRTFYCTDCITLEGLLAAFPELAAKLDIVRIAYPRPRAAVVAALGEANQNLPALAFAEGGFVNDQPGLLRALHARHGFPEPHP
ncbi:DUF3088 domain-containing protein [Sphingomonas sp. M1-B02]|uniref:DUF3088 domain-containing protein n=1 Tax=Sphingomonas sp. M1-B02 TaxID=3114300 RepID=UPI00223FE7CC|nr:DUF3088 domain-containing protein [Sphingomonas sp. S6-11]UZK67075.1 DUF3088 domain-containing protein [Sphingomonas sp. S6-11]